jgi:hypothetical protein
MNRIAMISLALLLSAPAAAKDKVQTAPEGADAPTPKMESLLQNCDAHKFETTVESIVAGKPHRSKVKMCGTEGQSDAAWIGTLKDAIAKLEASKEMPEATRNQIITAVKAEIARLEGQGSSSANGGPLPAGRPISSADSLSDDYSVLPPLKTSPPPPSHVLPPSTQSAVAATDSTPAAASPEPIAAPPPDSVVAPAPPPPAKPKLAFSCISPEYPGGGPCVTISRDTLLSVKAGEAVASGLSLRFVRQGDQRAELALGSMRKGQSLRFALPQRVCSGVVSGEVTIDVVQGGRVVDRQGPSLLRC